MKSILLCLVLALAVAFGRPDSGFPFDRNDSKWKNVRGEDITFESIMAILKKYDSIPEMKQMNDLLLQMREAYLSMNMTVPEKLTDPDVFRTVPEIITDKGYPAEEHTITTSDGYIISLFRIPHGRNTSAGGPPVLLSHGLMDSAGTWMVNLPDQSLAFILADAGYDVWLGNIRGNKYGDSHAQYGSLDPRLWDLSFDEQGKIDIPETLDYIRNLTSYSRVSLVGHSQGCTQLFASFYMHPEVADKLNLFVALAPALYFEKNVNVVIHVAAHLYLAELMELIGIDKFFLLADSAHRLLAQFCEEFPLLVESFLGIIMGYNPGEVEYSRYGVMCYQSLGFTSVQNMVHWAQMVRTAEFKAHDFGYFGNRDRYGSSKPPIYELNKIYPKNLPLAIFYGSLDTLVSPWDTEDVIADLPMDPIFIKHIPRYSHADFIWGKYAYSDVYADILTMLAKYAPTK